MVTLLIARGVVMRRQSGLFSHSVWLISLCVICAFHPCVSIPVEDETKPKVDPVLAVLAAETTQVFRALFHVTIGVSLQAQIVSAACPAGRTGPHGVGIQ